MIRLFSWNVNGIRAVNKKGAWQPFLDKFQPDILCLQEIKARPEQIDVAIDGYDSIWNPADRPGYSGTGLLTKLKPQSIRYGLPDAIVKQFKIDQDRFGDSTKEGRVLAVEFPKFWVVSVYTPNSKDTLGRLSLREKYWDPAFLAYMKQLEQTKPVIFCGDFNVAHTEDDLANPGPNRGKKGFTDEERAGFQAFIDNGFIDTLRLFKHGNGYYTWWSHFAHARERNVGWRIDYFLVSSSLKNKVAKADIHPEVMGSDHCPISLELNL